MTAPEDLQIGAIHWKDKKHFPRENPSKLPLVHPSKLVFIPTPPLRCVCRQLYAEAQSIHAQKICLTLLHPIFIDPYLEFLSVKRRNLITTINFVFVTDTGLMFTATEKADQLRRHLQKHYRQVTNVQIHLAEQKNRQNMASADVDDAR